ncbi:hypothetical protein HRM2_41960 [Desulforapulum autotrophicum HRM2]|uniref:Rubrerythrin rubredoxin-like domain-containing protein n=2 Tax=Desulforapulum autotrophicum TaxID=2296 RepID=C0QD20_DESAH|nr:hypothetical protein HRM2_41960 [Desulforapulum autotrophicum HRM2]
MNFERYLSDITLTIKGGTMTSWICDKCGYRLEAETPPEECPSCKKKCSFVDNSCYTPDCQGQPIDPRIKNN